jgi:hypothetical protein
MEPKPKKEKKAVVVPVATPTPATTTPDCDTLIEDFKAKKKARLERQAKVKKDHRTPEKKLVDSADKKVSGIINNIIKMSKKKELSQKTRKDLLTILKSGVKHIENK